MGKLARAHADTLVVIGVQSPKYPAEANPAVLRLATDRYGIDHPVVNDPDMRVWESYAVNAWPTLVFLSPEGRVIGSHAGEASFEALDGVMRQIVEEYDRAGSLVRGPVDFSLESHERPLSTLAFPGSVSVVDSTLFVSDSGHHRVVVSDLDGSVRQVIGAGTSGLVDGTFEQACFNRPQGLAYDGASRILYIADTENHVIRAADLERMTVSTVAGTGQQATRRIRRGPALEVEISSPWDVTLHDGALYIAMAGLHQIWQLDLASQVISVWAGTGHEAIKDGPRQEAWLAQPMAIDADSGALYVACAEAQAIRRINLESGAIDTLVGRGLFTFGDEDGPAATALLQHPQGVAARDATVYLSDTYNNKIKRIDPQSGEVWTYAGSGVHGTLDGPGLQARFNEPNGISVTADTLYVADTNNHLIRTIELDSGHVRTLRLQGSDISVSGE